MGLRDAISIGIGGMVGGGIFAVLGLAVELAQGGTPLAFFFAGIIAFLTAKSYALLSLAYPDRGGTVKFMNEGFGIGVISGGLNNLLWVGYIIMLSLYASAFGSYAPNLLAITHSRVIDGHIFMSAVILIATFINYYNIKVIGEIESLSVGIKLIILVLFIFIGFYGLIGNPNLHQLSPHYWESPLKLISGGMVIFVAYEGFELIANTAPDIEQPKKNIPKAYTYSVVFVIFLYIAIATITVGSLPFSEIAKAKDYVLAEAAMPILGKIGFTIMTIAALISTFSAINASLYGGSRVSYELAEDDETPHEFTKYLWNRPIGLAVTSFLTLVVSNTFNLEMISTAGSMGFLLIFAMVNLVAYKKANEIGANKFVTLSATFLCIMALTTLTAQQWHSNYMATVIGVAIIVGCFVGEYIYKHSDLWKRQLKEL